MKCHEKRADGRVHGQPLALRVAGLILALHPLWLDIIPKGAGIRRDEAWASADPVQD